MKILILTEAGGNIGLGHISRCTSIYQACLEKGITPEFIVHGPKHIESLLKDKRYRILDWINNKQVLFEALTDCDIAFVDSYLADRQLYIDISKRVDRAVYFDDDLRIDYPKGVVLNGAISAEKLNYPVKEGVTYLLGTSYFPLKKEFSNIDEIKIRTKVKTVLITCGGSDIVNLTPKIQTLLNKDYPDLHKKIVVTSLFSNIDEIKKVQDKNTELLWDLNAANFRSAMLDSDIAISAGGQTLYELASTGLPTIAVCVAENQSNNVSSWSMTGAMEYAGMHNEENLLSRLGTALDKLMSYNKRVDLSNKSNKLIDGTGAKRIYDLLVQ